MEIGTEAAQFLFFKYINGIFVAVWPIVKIALSFIPTGGLGRKEYQNLCIW